MELKEGATLPEGVSTEEKEKSTEHLPSLVDRRQELIDSIASGIEEANKADMVEFDGEKLIPAEGAKKDEEPPKAEDKPPEDSAKKDDETPLPANEPPDDPKHKLVIDGQEQEVPLSKILDAGKRALQKDLAADKRLEEATKLLKEARERTEAIYQPPGKGAGKDDPPKTDADKAVLKKALEAIRYGSDEEAEAAFEKVISKTDSAKSPDVSMILAEVETRTAAKTILSKFSAPADKGGFADIEADPDLKLLAARKVDELITSGKGALDWATYEEAGNYVRNKFGKPTTTAAIPDDKGFKTKAERKKGMDTITPAGGRVPKTPTKDDDTPKTPADVIAEMKRSRVGQSL